MQLKLKEDHKKNQENKEKNNEFKKVGALMMAAAVFTGTMAMTGCQAGGSGKCRYPGCDLFQCR